MSEQPIVPAQTIEQSEQQVDIELKLSDKLAVGRTKMALERTLMAAIRTSVSMISFGFTIAKFFQDIKSMDSMKGAASISSHNVGLWLVFIGTIYAIASAVQYQLVTKNLHFKDQKDRIPFTFLLAIVISLLGLALSISFYSNFLSLGLDK